MNRRYIGLGIVVSSVLLVAIGLWMFVFSKHAVEIIYNKLPGVELSLYRIDDEELMHDYESIDLSKQRLVTHVDTDKISLSNGSYVIDIGGKGIKKDRYSFNVEGSSSSYELLISYSDEYLESLRKSEFPKITTALRNAYPNFDKLYSLKPGKIYLDGTWYASRLRYIGSNNLLHDVLRVVLHKEKGNWVVMTDPPQIVLQYSKYEHIPKQILEDINKDEDLDTSQLGE